MVIDCTETNLTLPPEILKSSSGQIVTMQEVIGSHNKMYMIMILLSSTIIFLYILYTNFVMNTRFDFLKHLDIDVHELAILPGVALMYISLSFFGVI